VNAKSAAIVTDPHPEGHIVYPYTDEALVGPAVALFARSGLNQGEGVILVMTAAHWEPITRRLAMEGFDVDALQHSKRLVCAIAEDLLAELLVDGVPNEDRLRTIVGGMIANCRAAAGNGPEARVRVFGEMVSLLWNPHLGATISLEEMWNRLIETHHIALMCTYALNGRDAIPPSLHELHSHSVTV
jgi:hypothetical protein